MSKYELTGIIKDFGMPVCNILVINPDNNTASWYYAIIDTGSYDIHIKKSIAEYLGLISKGTVTTSLPMGNNSDTQECFIIDMVIDSEHFVSQVCGKLNNESYPVDIIIGTKFLENKTFVCDWINMCWRIYW